MDFLCKLKLALPFCVWVQVYRMAKFKKRRKQGRRRKPKKGKREEKRWGRNKR